MGRLSDSRRFSRVSSTYSSTSPFFCDMSTFHSGPRSVFAQRKAPGRLEQDPIHGRMGRFGFRCCPPKGPGKARPPGRTSAGAPVPPETLPVDNRTGL